MRARRILPFVLVLALAPAACDDALGPQIELTQAEVMELFYVLNEILALDMGLSPALAGEVLARGFAPPVALETLVGGEPCPDGGFVTVTYAID
jgi:hypothetical protein